MISDSRCVPLDGPTIKLGTAISPQDRRALVYSSALLYLLSLLVWFCDSFYRCLETELRHSRLSERFCMLMVASDLNYLFYFFSHITTILL